VQQAGFRRWLLSLHLVSCPFSRPHGGDGACRGGDGQKWCAKRPAGAGAGSVDGGRLCGVPTRSADGVELDDAGCYGELHAARCA
jgi:hypothetical protein